MTMSQRSRRSGIFAKCAATGLPVVATASAATSSTTSPRVATSAAIIAARALLHRARLVDGKRASAEVLAIPHVNGLRGVIIATELNETEALRTTAHLIHDDEGRRDSSSLRERFLQLIVRSRVRETADIEFLRHVSIRLFRSY